MNVALVRHGDAESSVAEGLDDTARALTASARSQLPAYFAALGPRLGAPARILMSPAVRATQTATILAAAIGHEGPVVCESALQPGKSPRLVLALLEGLDPEDGVIVVGHQPTIGAVAAQLLGLDSYPRAIYPGSVIGLHLPAGEQRWRLDFHASPALELYTPG